MRSITLRNIPDDVLDRVRTLARVRKRSLNNELLALIERGLAGESNRPVEDAKAVVASTQLAVWRQLGGHWDDERSAEEIISDIYKHRTPGRDVQL
jgi:plasmid stability protein